MIGDSNGPSVVDKESARNSDKHQHSTRETWKPYKPLGSMSSVLHLKLVLVKENHMSGEKVKKFVGKRNSGGERDDAGTPLLATATHATKAQAKSRRSLNRVLKMERSATFSVMQARNTVSKSISKAISAGTTISSHYTPRTIHECIKFALSHVRTCPALVDLENELFEMIAAYEYNSHSHGLDRIQSESSLSSFQGSSHHAHEQKTFVTQQPSIATTIAPVAKPKRDKFSHVSVAEKLDFLLTANGVADEALHHDDGDHADGTDGDQQANQPQHKSPRRPIQKSPRANSASPRVVNRRSKFLSEAKVVAVVGGGVGENGVAGSPEHCVDPVESIVETVHDIFESRAAVESMFERQLEASDFVWPQQMLDRSRAFIQEPPKDLPSVVMRFKNVIEEYNEVVAWRKQEGDKSISRKKRTSNSSKSKSRMIYDADKPEDEEEEIEILVTPRTFRSFKEELEHNQRKAASRRQQATSGRIHGAPWFIEAARYTRGSLKGKRAPMCVLEFLTVLRRLIEHDFSFTKELMFELMVEILKSEDHKVYAVQHMTKKLREHVGIDPVEYLEWLKGRDIQPPAHLIREVKMILQRKKNQGGKDPKTPRARKKKKGGGFGITPSLAALNEASEGGDRDDDEEGSEQGGSKNSLSAGQGSAGQGSDAVGQGSGVADKGGRKTSVAQNMSLSSMMNMTAGGDGAGTNNDVGDGSLRSGTATSGKGDLTSVTQLMSQLGVAEKRNFVDDNRFVGVSAGGRRGSKMGGDLTPKAAFLSGTVKSPPLKSKRKMSLNYTT
jgi:hypothetical protein